MTVEYTDLTAEDVCNLLGGKWNYRSQTGMACCPAHDDRNPSLSIKDGDDGKLLLYCHAGCSFEEIIAAIPDLQGTRKKRPDKPSGGSGLTLAQYALAKNLPMDFLLSVGCFDATYNGKPAVAMRYRAHDGACPTIQYRVTLTGKKKFYFQEGMPTLLYGLDRPRVNYCILVEGPSDCHTLWSQGFNALGLPGAANWDEERDAPAFDGLTEIYVVIEPDKSGEAVLKWLSKSSIRRRAKLVHMSRQQKDPSAMYLADPVGFDDRFLELVNAAKPYTRLESISAFDLCAMEFPELTWVVNNLIPEGLTLIVGEPKLGKSYLTLRIGKCIARGTGEVLGETTMHSDVCYLALEDPKRRAKHRVLELLDRGEPIPKNLRLVFRAPTVQDGLIEALEDELYGYPNTKVFIIDTYSRIEGRQHKNINLFQHDTDIMGRLADFAHEHGISILIPHHTNRSGVGMLDKISGSNGRAAQADTVLMLTRLENMQARLQILGREVESQDMTLQFDDNDKLFSVIGDYTKPAKQSRQHTDIMEYLDSKHEPSTVEQIANLIDKSKDTARSVLRRMESAGKVRRTDKDRWVIA